MGVLITRATKQANRKALNHDSTSFENGISIQFTAAPNKKLLTYYETQMQFVHQVLEKPDEYFNDNVLGKFYTKDFEL